MKCAVYQYYVEDEPDYVRVSKSDMAAYAKQAGATYIFDKDPTFMRVPYANYLSALRPIYDSRFHDFDRVLFVDCDVFPTMTSFDIFQEPCGHLAMVAESHAPDVRQKTKTGICLNNDLKWKKLIERRYRAQTPVDELGRPLVYNSGVVLYSKEGLRALKKAAPSILLYHLNTRLSRLPRFYRLDQNFLGLLSFLPGIDFQPLQQRYNAFVSGYSDAQGKSHQLSYLSHDSELVHLQAGSRRLIRQDSFDGILSFLEQ